MSANEEDNDSDDQPSTTRVIPRRHSMSKRQSMAFELPMGGDYYEITIDAPSLGILFFDAREVDGVLLSPADREITWSTLLGGGLPGATVAVNILPLAIDTLQNSGPLGQVLVRRALVDEGALLEEGDDGHVAAGQKPHAGKLHDLLLGNDDVLVDHHGLHDGNAGGIAAGTDPDGVFVDAERFVHGIDLGWILVGEGLEPGLGEFGQVLLNLGFVAGIVGGRHYADKGSRV